MIELTAATVDWWTVVAQGGPLAVAVVAGCMLIAKAVIFVGQAFIKMVAKNIENGLATFKDLSESTDGIKQILIDVREGQKGQTQQIVRMEQQLQLHHADLLEIKANQRPPQRKPKS